ncbi:MAG: GntR family transcriptional regulator [Thermofilaceae archaeon]
MRIDVEKIQFIYENHNKMSIKELAEKLNLSTYQIAKVLQELKRRNLIQRKKRVSVYDKFVEMLKNNA